MWREGYGRNAVYAIASIALSVGLLSGCSRQPVQYVEDQNASEAENNTLENFVKADKWMEFLQITDVDGNEVMVKINARVNVPDVEEMSVVKGTGIAEASGNCRGRAPEGKRL